MRTSVLGAIAAAAIAFGAPAAAQERLALAASAEPDLAGLATPSDIAAAGEATPTQRVGGSGASEVEVDGETISLEEQEVRVEGTSFRTFYRRDPTSAPR